MSRIQASTIDFEEYNARANAKALEVIEERGFEEVVSPSGDNVIVRRLKHDGTTESGIVLPGEPEQINQGMVISAGQGCKGSFKPGDHVIFGEFAGSNQIQVNGEFLLVLREDEVSGKLDRVPCRASGDS